LNPSASRSTLGPCLGLGTDTKLRTCCEDAQALRAGALIAVLGGLRARRERRPIVATITAPPHGERVHHIPLLRARAADHRREETISIAFSAGERLEW
jgi:hypothetical protein